MEMELRELCIKCDKLYPDMSCLFLHFLEDGYISNVESTKEGDIAVINKHLDMTSSTDDGVWTLKDTKNMVRKRLTQGKAMLALPIEEFPWEWIEDTMHTRGLSREFNKFDGSNYSAAQCYHNWFTWIMEVYEAGARERGLC